MNMNLEIQSNDRVFICGQTGTGKTFLAKHLFDQCLRGVIYSIDWEILPGETYEHVHSIKKIDWMKSQKYVLEPHRDTAAAMDDFCEWVFYENTNMTTYIEEIGDFLETDANLEHFATLLRRGRKHGLGMIMTTQRPQGFRTKLPITQSQHVIVFRMFEEQDVRFVLKCAGLGKDEEEMVRNLKEYEFFYYNVREGRAEIMPAVKVE